MVRITINNVEYSVQTKWEEVDVPRLIKAMGFREELKVLTTIDHHIIDIASNEQLWPIYTLTSFRNELNDIPVLPSVDVGEQSYEQLENAKIHLREGSESQKLLKVASIYYESETNPVALLGLGISLVASIRDFLEKFKALNDRDPDPEAEQAGIEELAKFGSWATAFELAGEDVLKLREIWKMPAKEIYIALWYQKDKADYQKRLIDIKTKKRPK